MKIKNILYVLLFINIMMITDIYAMEQPNVQQTEQPSRKIYPSNLPLLLLSGCLKNAESCLSWLPTELIVEIINHARKIKTDQDAGLFMAVIANDKDTVIQLLNEPYIDVNVKNKYGSTPLIWAVDKNNPKIIQILLDNGANPNIEDNDGDTALIWAVIYNKPKIVQILLDNGANPNSQDPNIFHNALWWAKESNNQNIIKILEDYTSKEDKKLQTNCIIA